MDFRIYFGQVNSINIKILPRKIIVDPEYIIDPIKILFLKAYFIAHQHYAPITLLYYSHNLQYIQLLYMYNTK